MYPLQALVKGIELRFKYHFQGSRNTNRVDKVCLLSSLFYLLYFQPLHLALALQIADVQPEWAFANILDQIYEHQSFIKEYLQPLTTKAGYDINVKVNYLPSFMFLSCTGISNANNPVRIHYPPLSNPTSIPQIPGSSFTRPPRITSSYDISNYLI